jgi:large subunit ribosomal protein L3
MAENANSVENKVDLPAFFGVKAGMTRVFDESGNHVPVTVIKLVPNYISQVKTLDKDGYEAYQIAYFEKKAKNLNKPELGHLKKAGLDSNLARLEELRIESVQEENLGKQVSLGLFNDIQYIDATGVSKGKGFQGTMKRYNFSGGPATHGSHFHRGPGSIGNRATPGRVFAGKKMPGRMGGKVETVQNIKVQELNLEKGYILLKGSVPGSKNSFVRISKAVKK